MLGAEGCFVLLEIFLDIDTLDYFGEIRFD